MDTMKSFRIINYLLSISTWKHVWFQLIQCIRANKEQSYWDTWRWR